MAAYQIFLGEEPLLLATMGMILFAAAYGVLHRDVVQASWRPLLKGLGIAAAVCAPIILIPIYYQFAGPQSYKSVLHGDNAGNSPLALLSFAERSLIAGNEVRANSLSLNPTEQNAFYGWPLVALAFAIVVRLWEHALVKALAFTAVAAAILSMGPKIRIPLTDTVYSGPWALLAHKPLFESVIEGRVAMICAPALGMLLAIAVDKLAATRQLGTQYVGLLAVSMALIPIIPAPLKAVDRATVPAFFTDGTYKSYVRAGESIVPAPARRPRRGGAPALADRRRPRLQDAGRLFQRPLRRRPHRHLRRPAPLHLQHAAGRPLHRCDPDHRQELAGAGQGRLRVLARGRAGDRAAAPRRQAPRGGGEAGGAPR